jgi:prolyl oligopeptidase
MNEPPAAPREDSAYEYHGETIDDPYLWLEDGDDEEVRSWVADQNGFADDHLGDLPAREHLRPRVEELARIREFHPVKPSPSGYFQRIREGEEDHPVLYHFDDLDGDGRVLVDPNELGDETTAVNWYAPSPDGELVAYGVDEDGAEQYDVHVMDVETREEVDVVPDAGRTSPGMLAWTDEGFYYVRTGSVGGEGQLDKELRYHELGAEVDDEPVVADDFGPQTWPSVVSDPDCDQVFVATMEGWERTDLYHVPKGSTEGMEPILEGYDAMFVPLLRGEDCYLRSSYEADNYRVSRLDAGDLDAVDGPDDLETVVPEDDDAIMEAFTATADRLLVKRNRDVVSEVHAYDRDGDSLGEVDLPGTGSVDALVGSRTTDEAFLVYQSFDHPQAVMRQEGGASQPETVASPDVAVEADVEVSQEWFESEDGTEVPMFVVRREDVERDGSNPAVLYGYGGFEQSLTPRFRKYVAPFLEDGGVFAVANCRGGGEFGKEWHHAARHEKKQNTFDDFHAAAEHLVEREYTDTDRLACYGGSNGGLTVGAAVTQRPDLFGAALCAVPLLDMLRFHRSLLGRSWTSEYGNAEDDPEAFEYIREYSPYHNVSERAYPATLLVTAASDTRVDPFHAWKMAARLQRRHAGEEPVLLKTYESTGHGVGKPISKVVDEQLDQWGFLYDELGVLES